MSAMDEIYTPPAKETKGPVPWALKNWHEFTDADKIALGKHLKTFDSKEKARDYANYLAEFCGAPRDKLMDYIKEL